MTSAWIKPEVRTDLKGSVPYSLLLFRPVTPSFPRTRESRLSISEIMESLDSLVRSNDELLNLTGNAACEGKRRLLF
jgi:hypothetical protein